MQQYEAFIFESYGLDLEQGQIELKYSLDSEVVFKEILILPSGQKPVVSGQLDAALKILHIIGGTSYYKTCCPKKIEVQGLNQNQAQFFTAVYENGLGEFFYRNKIDFRGLINFPSNSNAKPTQSSKLIAHSSKVLVPIGGGKDSIVTIERLKKEGADITLLRMGSHPLIDEVVKITGLPCITVERTLSPTLFELNAEGALNGHVPITAYLSALCVVLAELYGFDSIAMSNEKSANFGNVEYLGREINHQWSKSEEFETAFQKYVHDFINPNLQYYSALRSATELEIVGEFCHYPQYFEHFTSCNKNWKIIREDVGSATRSPKGEVWCGTCPKCAFAFCLLAANLPKETVLKIFNANLFDDVALLPLYKELLGLEGCKPFECVGTPEETRQAFERIEKKGEFADSPILQSFQPVA